jgi:hypothetical protein
VKDRGEWRMMYLRALLAGICAAMIASVAYVLAVFVFPIAFPFLLSRITGTGGAAGASFSTGPVLAIALVAFIAGFCWQFRRSSKSRPRES